ncbi:MAG: hypothetical protein JWO32_402, partial [Bacteroidetes bacterium]|nr:hypothetical protein [Bacteroidota bacterium]
PIPANANTIYGGRQQMFKSTNQGTNWAQIGTIPGTSSIVEFAIAPSNNQVIYVIKGNTLYKTINGGTSWTTIAGLPTTAQLTWVTIKDTDPNSVWVTYSGYAAGTKVYQSTDGGTTWTNYSTGLPNLPTNCITYWNGTNNGLYVGSDVGVYYRDATMANWILYNAGLPNVRVMDLAIFYPLGKLRAATFGRGVWEADLYNNGTQAPIANFTSDKTFICPAMTVNYTDQSTFGPTSWSWIFQGGSPATSTVQNPSIVYNTPGTYSVSFTATNGNGSSVMTRTLYITVSGPNALPLVEGFQGTFVPANWQNYDAGNDNYKWTKSSTVGKASTASLMYDNYNLPSSNIRDEMRAPKLNFTGISSAKLYFDVAYSRYDPTYSDSLAVRVSTDCGLTYTQVYLKGGTGLATAPDFSTAVFVPSAAQWRTDTVYLNSYVGQSNVMVSFQNRGHYGQALYLDNINITGQALSSGPTASFSISAAAPCANQNVSFTDQSTNSPTSWSWSMPGSSAPTSTVSNPTVSYASGGIYTVTLVSSNAFGPSSPVSQTIQVNALPVVTATSPTASICTGQSIMISAAGATTYSWNTTATTSTIVVTPTVNTSYTVTGTNGNGCKNTAVRTITVNSLPTVNIAGGTTPVCNGSTVGLTASGANSYVWSNSSSASSIAVTVTANATYSVVGTNTNGCSNNASQTVSVNPTANITAPNGAICPGNSFTITPSGASTYTYSSGSAVVSPTATSSYTVNGTSALGCASVPAVVNVSVTPSLNVTISGSNSVCTGSSIILTANGASSYTWSGGVTTNTLSVNPTSNATYSVLGSGGAGCTGTNNIAITVNPLPVLSITSSTTTVCSGQPVSLIASGATTYTWNTGATGVSIAPSPTANATYTVTGTNGNGCNGSTTSAITVNSLPNVSVSSSSPLLCSGQSATLTATGANSYTWSNSSNSSAIVVTPTTNTSYSVNGTGANGCQNISSFTQSVSACTGINTKVNLPSLFVVYPNPSNGDFTVELSEASELVVYNLLAEIIVDKKFEQGKHQLTIGNKAAGVYFVKATSGQKQFVVKLIVE